MTWRPEESWRRFCLETEAAKNYFRPYALYTAGRTHRDPFLETLLPTLSYIRAVAILDDSLKLWLKQNHHRLPDSYRDLDGRLRYLGDNGLLENTDQLHVVRKERNRLAHQAGASCDWERLSNDMITMEQALVYLSLVRPTPQLEYFCERSAAQFTREPGILFSQRFSYGVKENGATALEVAWVQNVHNASIDASEEVHTATPGTPPLTNPSNSSTSPS